MLSLGMTNQLRGQEQNKIFLNPLIRTFYVSISRLDIFIPTKSGKF